MCSNTPPTIKHVLQECPKYETIRRKLKGKIIEILHLKKEIYILEDKRTTHHQSLG